MFDEANKMLQDVIDNHLLRAEGIVGLYRAQRDGDDMVIFDNDNEQIIGKLYGLRQQVYRRIIIINYVL